MIPQVQFLFSFFMSRNKPIVPIKLYKIFIIIFLLCAVLHSHLSYGQVVYDNNSVTVETAGPLSFTVPAGTDRLLVVYVGAFSTGDSGTAAATFNGQSMGKAITSEDFFAISHATSIIFYLALDDGAAITSNVTISGINSVGFIGANSYTGVDQTTPLGNTAQDIGDNNVTATSHTLSPTTSSGDLLVHFFTTASAINASLGGEATAFSGFSLGPPNQIVGGYKIATAVSHNLTTNFESAFGVWAHVAAEFNQVSTAPELDVRNNADNADITDGSTTINTTLGTDFGTVLVGNTSSSTFRAENNGTGTLTFGTDALAISNTTDYSITTDLTNSGTMAASGVEAFTIQFNPQSLGTKMCTVTIRSDDADEDPYTFQLQGLSPQIPTINLSVSTNSGAEAATTAITVTATASSTVTGNQTVDVGVSQQAGTITAGDYTLSNTTITIPDGQTTGTVTFTVADDNVFEGVETARLTISNPSSGVTLGSTTTQDIAITDNETVTLALDASTYSVNEGDGTVSVDVVISNIPTGNMEVAIPAVINTSNGTATAPDDYTALVNSTQSFPTTASNSDKLTFSITIDDDSDIESSENFTAALTSTLTGVTIGSPSTTTVTITDNDIPLPTVTIAIEGTTTVTEDSGGTITYRFTRTGDTTTNLDVNYSIGGTTQNEDFTVTTDANTTYIPGTRTGTITILAGNAFADLVITPLDEDLIEAAETVVVKIENP